jgi:hypothetical protein
MKIIEFTIVRTGHTTMLSSALDQLVVLVNKRIQEGWQPQGDVISLSSSFAQPMVRHESMLVSPKS